jgi:large subunit ribosomal protein L9
MEIILLERVEKLGQMGDVVKVKNGYARNFLLPRKKALRATERNRAAFDERRKDIEATNLEKRTEAEAVAARMEGQYCTLIRQAGESGQLYGSVTARDISDALKEIGFTLHRQQVILDHAIKTLGVHQVRLALHPEVSVKVGVNVARSAEEALTQGAKASAPEAAPSPEDFFENPADLSADDEAGDEAADA